MTSKAIQAQLAKSPPAGRARPERRLAKPRRTGRPWLFWMVKRVGSVLFSGQRTGRRFKACSETELGRKKSNY